MNRKKIAKELEEEFKEDEKVLQEADLKIRDNLWRSGLRGEINTQAHKSHP